MRGWTAAIADINQDLYIYDFSTGTATRLTSVAGREEEPTFSPNGRNVAFVRANNLHVVDVATRKEITLTSDGSRDILNGKLDWLYQEEIYGRGRFRGMLVESRFRKSGVPSARRATRSRIHGRRRLLLQANRRSYRLSEGWRSESARQARDCTRDWRKRPVGAARRIRRASF